MKCREWWRNCATQPDDEIIAIDQFENQITPLTPGVAATRQLISTFEVCHHKAERWATNIIEQSQRDNAKGSARANSAPSSAEELLSGFATLVCWSDGNQGTGLCGWRGVPAAHLIDLLGAPSPRKIWQVQRVIARIRSVVESAGTKGGDAPGFSWLLYSENPDRPFGGSRCPSAYKDAEQFWLATVCTMLEDTHNSTPVILSLGLAIDMLWPCHWNSENLEFVLGAIGGNLRTNAPLMLVAGISACCPREAVWEWRGRWELCSQCSCRRVVGTFGARPPGIGKQAQDLAGGFIGQDPSAAIGPSG